MNRVAIITGATSGFAEKFAKRLLGMGYDLIIIGRRKKLINKVAEDIRCEFKVNVTVKIVDLSNTEEFNVFINEIENRNDIEFLVNNAGHGAEESFTKDKYENQEEMINIINTGFLWKIYFNIRINQLEWINFLEII